MSWPTVPLEQIARISGGSTPRRNNDAYWNGDVPWVTPSDLPSPGASIVDVLDTAQYITQDGLESCSAPLLAPGTVLFSSRATIGKIGIANVSLATNQGFANFTPNPGVEPKYLAYALRYYTPQITALAGSTTFKEVSRGSIRKFQIPLPPPSEQRRIVELLDLADALQLKRAEADAKAQRILPALFMKMFGDPATNPMGWPRGSLAGFSNSVRYGLGQPPKASEDGLPLIRATNIRAGAITESNMVYVDAAHVPASRNAILSADEIIVVRSGAYTGDVAQVTEKWHGAVIGYDLVVSPAPGWTGEFIEQYLLSPFIQATYVVAQKSRAGQPHLNARQLSEVPIFNPPQQLQQKFAECVRSIRQIRDRATDCSMRLSTIFRLLSQKAFSCELTAAWRKEHIGDLLREAEEQAEALEAGGAESVRRRYRGRAKKATSC